MTVVDLDDFTDANNGMERLLWLKQQIPQFKVTLFAIPAETSPAWLQRDDLKDWVSIVMHGWEHKTNYECHKWTKAECQWHMEGWVAVHHFIGVRIPGRIASRRGYVEHGFKAPGWQISDGCYEALLDAGWWVADAEYNGGRRPAGLKAYVLGRSDIHQIHGHLGHRGGHNGNELELIHEQILARKDDEFGFVRDFVK